MNNRVIIAEDSSIIKSIFQRILKAHNFSITSAKNGVEVLQLIEDDNYDIILMDVNMPKMDGITCTQQIRNLGGKKSFLPIIGISGNPENLSKEYYLSVGFTDFVEKPINYDLVVRLIKDLSPKNGN